MIMVALRVNFIALIAFIVALWAYGAAQIVV